jgi:hypothetical protein
MATTKRLFFERPSGPFRNGYDRWHLISERGTFFVEHSWSHPSAIAGEEPEVGSTVEHAGRLFGNGEDDDVQRALRQAITAIIVSGMDVHFTAADMAASIPLGSAGSVATTVDWLAACSARDIDRLIAFYSPAATLECACTGNAMCTGTDELRAYWLKRLADPSPSLFALRDVSQTPEGTVLDYLSHGGQLVRSRFYFTESGLIHRSKCGPVELAKAG